MTPAEEKRAADDWVRLDKSIGQEPKLHPDSAALAASRCDPSLPAILGNHGLGEFGWTSLRMWHATGDVDAIFKA